MDHYHAGSYYVRSEIDNQQPDEIKVSVSFMSHRALKEWKVSSAPVKTKWFKFEPKQKTLAEILREACDFADNLEEARARSASMQSWAATDLRDYHEAREHLKETAVGK